MQQRSDEWLNKRKNYIGSSDAPVIMGVSPYKRSDGLHRTPYVLWREKLGMLLDETPNSSMIYGTEMESTSRHAYEAFVNEDVSPAVIYHPTIPYLMASLDGLSTDKKYMVEIKNTNKKNHEMAKNGQIPIEFMPQLQHQMECCDDRRDEMHYWSSFNGDNVLVEVKKDLDFIEQMLDLDDKFWKCVQNFQAPPLCDRDYIEMSIGHDEALRVMEIKNLQSNLAKERKDLEKKLQSMCDGKNAIFGNVKYSCCMALGTVKYSKIPELANVDLDAYRGDVTKRWTTSFLK